MDDASVNEATIWEAVADAMGGLPAIRCGDQVVSWSEFDNRASRLAAAFTAMGVRPGSRIAIDLYNSPVYLEAVFAAFKVRAAPININYRYRERELLHLLNDSNSSALVFHGALGERIRAVTADLGRPLHLIQVDDGHERVEGAYEYEALLTDHHPAPRIPRGKDDEFILYTGGTTGMPRGVVWSHASLFEMQSAQYARRGLEAPETLRQIGEAATYLAQSDRPPIVLVVSPLMHGTGILTSMGAFVLGGPVVLCASRSLDGDEICALIEKHRIRSLALVGDVFAKPILEALDRAESKGAPYDVSSLEQISSAGVTWSTPVKQGLLRHGDILLVDAVAATEGGGFASSEMRRGDDIETSHFRLGPNARVLDSSGEDVRPGSGVVGVLATTGPLPNGYLNDPAKTEATFRMMDGKRYVVPGDMATIEADGTIVLLGRGSEVINTGGEKVFVEEVEQAIADHPSVRDVVVVGVPDERWGHTVTAVVALQGPATLTEGELIDFVGGRLADYKRPRRVVFVQNVERSPSGKADRRWARDAVEGTEMAST
jgi:3-oxocholest-4-en-26-oate---CoA ligase